MHMDHEMSKFIWVKAINTKVQDEVSRRFDDHEPYDWSEIMALYRADSDAFFRSYNFTMKHMEKDISNTLEY
jgi:hypothetical protein